MRRATARDRRRAPVRLSDREKRLRLVLESADGPIAIDEAFKRADIPAGWADAVLKRVTLTWVDLYETDDKRIGLVRA